MTNSSSVRRAESGFPAELTTRCVLLLVLGVVALGLRVAAVFLPRASLTVLTLLFGGFALADGVASAAVGLRRISRQGMVLVFFLRAALGIGLGVFALGASIPDVRAMSRLFGLWALGSGALDLAVASGALRGQGGRLLGVAGGVSVAAGLILTAWPVGDIPFLVVWIAGYAILVGILLLIRITRLV
jgi:uncharacterized membrane protein HdeD (DUF308 family)